MYHTQLTGKLLYFNSQPHEEADPHNPSSSSTVRYFNSQPHEEADGRTQDLYVFSNYFNSQPHEEADSNFKQKLFYLKLFFIFIA